MWIIFQRAGLALVNAQVPSIKKQPATESLNVAVKGEATMYSVSEIYRNK